LFFLELVGGGFQAGRSVVEFFLSLAELDFELGLCRLGGRRITQHAVAVDIADLEFLRRHRRARQQCCRRDDAGGEGKQGLGSQRTYEGSHHQNAVPIWNWKRWILS
jgi:hypothetical protein